MAETSNVIYNFQNHIMTNVQRVIIKNLENTISDDHNNVGDGKTLINSFKALVLSKCPLIIPVEITNDLPDDWEGLEAGDELTLKDDIHLRPITIHEKDKDTDEDANKKEYMVGFTRLEEAKLGPESNTCNIQSGKLLNIALFKDDVDGIVINPFGDTPFTIDKEMIDSLFKYCIDHGPCKSEKYYDEHQKEENNYAPKGIELFKALNLADEAYHKEIRHFWWCGRRSCTFCASFRYIIFGGLLRQHLCLNL